MSKKVPLVTGSGKKRVGWYVAEALAKRGYSLVIHYRSSEEEAMETQKHFESEGIDAIAIQADLAKEDDVKGMMAKVKDHFGRIDLLVNCAAIWQSKPLEEVTADDLRLNFDINALGTFLCSQHAGLMMVDQAEGGLIVTIGDWALERPYKDHAAYFPSKGAVVAMTKSLAVELAARNTNIRVNCIMPGPVMLPPDLPDDVRQEAIDATLVKREGSPKNIAQSVLFLVDNDFVTGVVLPVDGGRTIFSE